MTNKISNRVRSDRGSGGRSGVIAIGVVAFLALWSHGTLAPMSGIVPGSSSYENQPGNDFASGFVTGYSESRCKIDWVLEDPADCPFGQGDSYIDPDDRNGGQGSEVASS